MGYFWSPLDSKSKDLTKSKPGISHITHHTSHITQHVLHMTLKFNKKFRIMMMVLLDNS